MIKSITLMCPTPKKNLLFPDKTQKNYTLITLYSSSAWKKEKTTLTGGELEQI